MGRGVEGYREVMWGILAALDTLQRQMGVVRNSRVDELRAQPNSPHIPAEENGAMQPWGHARMRGVLGLDNGPFAPAGRDIVRPANLVQAEVM